VEDADEPVGELPQRGVMPQSCGRAASRSRPARPVTQ
jgi:hypothetical protein